jgi:hypothetical protein
VEADRRFKGFPVPEAARAECDPLNRRVELFGYGVGDAMCLSVLEMRLERVRDLDARREPRVCPKMPPPLSAWSWAGAVALQSGRANAVPGVPCTVCSVSCSSKRTTSHGTPRVPESRDRVPDLSRHASRSDSLAEKYPTHTIP